MDLEEDDLRRASTKLSSDLIRLLPSVLWTKDTRSDKDHRRVRNAVSEKSLTRVIACV